MINQESNLVASILEALDSHRLTIDTNDVLAIASKIVATVQKRLVKLDSVQPSQSAKHLAQRVSLEPRFVEVVLQEADEVYGGVPKAILTLKDNILTANAGVDHKNAPPGYVVLWPKFPFMTAKKTREEILDKIGRSVGVLIVDSRVTPLRMGTTGLSLAVAGFEPVSDERGKRDLFKNVIRVTQRALADDISAGAQLLMGEVDEGIPVVLVRNTGLKMTDRPIKRSKIAIHHDECIFVRGLSSMRPLPSVCT